MPHLDASLPLDTLPQMLLDVPTMERNIAVKEAWACAHGMVLAPHIKTTMTRQIVQRQLPGAWGVTVATPAQALQAAAWGAERILMANEVVFRPHLRQLRHLLAGSESLQIYCLADSAAGVRIMAEEFDGASRPLRVLVDVGTPGGRTGIRSADEAPPLARRIAGASGLLLAGVSAYEGVAPNLRTADNLARVDAHCRQAREVFDGLRPLVEADLPETEAPVFTIGGSAFQDRAALFLPAGPAVNVLRSGCYVVHDHGTYAEVSPVEGLAPAAVVRALVISAPEPGRVVLNAGKRELAYDAGLPMIVACHRNGVELSGTVPSRAVPSGCGGTVAKLFDHHAVVDDVAGLEVGDTVDLGISHPCSLFDRWRDIVAVNGAATETWHPVF